MKRAWWLWLPLLLVACGGSPILPTVDFASHDATSIARQVATIRARDAREATPTITLRVTSTRLVTSTVTPLQAAQPISTPLASATPSGPLARLLPGNDHANVRSGPGIDYPIVGRLEPTVTVRIVGRNEGCTGSTCIWWQIDNAGHPGWVSGQLVETLGDTIEVRIRKVAPAPTATPAPYPQVLVKAGYDFVNVRSGPGLTYDVVGQLQANTPERVTGRSANGSWWQIDYGGTPRWVDGGFVDMSGEVSAIRIAAAPAKPTALARAAAPAATAVVALAQSSSGCPTTSNASYELVPRDGPASDRPDRLHGDLNLGLRGYSPTSAPASLVDYNGTSDPNAPRFTGMFQPNRVATISSVYRVNLWYFEPQKCNGAPYGCAGPAITSWPVTLIGLATTPGERISIPSRAPIIWPNEQALVLYADTTRITINYTRQDNISYGYVVYIENVCVDPNLLALYRAQNDANGWRRSASLPGLRNGQPLGTAAGSEIRVAIRDSATFMDPRSRKDWWQP